MLLNVSIGNDGAAITNARGVGEEIETYKATAVVLGRLQVITRPNIEFVVV